MTNEELDLIHPIGSIYETLDNTFNPNEIWGGSWYADDTESVLVSQNSTDLFSASLGSIVGDNTAITNLPNHTHQTSASTVSNTNAWFSFRGVSKDSTRGAYGPGSWTAAAVGGGGSHENRMRSKYVIRWIRVA